jgi:hypothetical protein
MPELLLSLASPESLKFIVLTMLAIFARDFIVGALRRVSKRLLTDKDPKNDVLGEALDQAADSIERAAAAKSKANR